MVVRTFLSALTGVAVWAFALVAGLELALAWGIIAFAFELHPLYRPVRGHNPAWHLCDGTVQFLAIGGDRHYRADRDRFFIGDISNR